MRRPPGATYRLQFHAGFAFQDAAAIADYLAALGVSHVYCSPYLQAAPGSTHGYDVVDPTRVNEELGGAAGHDLMRQAFERAGLGQVLDIVPNHMAITGRENAWWWDVLENGPASRYASYFDVDWFPPEARLSNKVLLPILGDHYGRVIDAGEIRIRRQSADLTIAYYDKRFPIAPRSIGVILERAAARDHSAELAYLADAFASLPPSFATDRTSTARRHRDKQVLRELLERLLERRHEAAIPVDAAIAEFNANPDELSALLDRQNYRLAFWKIARSDLGYRRFFDVNSLVGLRTEDESVFADTHALAIAWLQRGVLDGVRVDHPDGLQDPQEYFHRLRAAAPDAWIVAEKILARKEALPAAWEVDGTTGYDFMNLVGGLFVDPGGEKPLTEFYAAFTGETADYAALVHEKKHLVLRELFGSDFNRLAELLLQIGERHRAFRDYGRDEINGLLREAAACFPVYRSYVRPAAGQIADADRQAIAAATAAARDRRPDLDPLLFDFLQDLLTLQRRGELENELVIRFQQATPPVAAKGLEDTAFYDYNRFVGLNEVGGEPAIFGVAAEEFHEAMRERQRLWPASMSATSTHDTKRSEDVRARLAVLSEIPGRFAGAVRKWAKHNNAYRTGDDPDRNAEYFLYQTLIGAWPISLERVAAYMLKAAREAKTHTSWLAPDGAYEEGLRLFVERALQDPWFVAELENLLAIVIPPGRVNSLAQTLIKLTAPGVPDIYQGNELWDLSLVDPDNRRPVDYEQRRRLLAELSDAAPEAVMARMDEGLPKLWVCRQALALRRRRPEWFGAAGGYAALAATGKKREHVLAFARANSVATIVPLRPLSLAGKWGDAAVEIPAGRWRNLLTLEDLSGGRVLLRDMLRRFPVALLARDME
jgi:(1->4)-alpha-D-glucan 1-alpha-D-glucosylmutase